MCSNNIFEINLKLLQYEILEKLVTYMLTLESRRFVVMGEVSLCTRTLPNCLELDHVELDSLTILNL